MCLFNLVGSLCTLMPLTLVSAHGKVFDPTVTPPFGLVEVKCYDTDSVAEVKHLTRVRGQAILNESQLLLAGSGPAASKIMRKDLIILRNYYKIRIS